MIPPRKFLYGIAPLLLGWLLAVPPVRALDFQLHSTSVEEDGFRREQWYIRNDAKTRVVLSLPGGWTHSDDPNSLSLTPPNTTNALVRVERSNLGPSVAFQGPGLEVYRKRLLADIPQGATAVKVGAEQADPLPIFDWKSYELTVDYEFFGQAYRRSIVFVNLDPRQQITMTAVALRTDYERVHAVGMDLLRSWQVMPVVE